MTPEPFAVQKDGRGFNVYHHGRCLEGVCYDEMLWCVAHFAHRREGKPWASQWPEASPWGGDWILQASYPDWWLIECGGRFIPFLTDSEMLGFVAAFALGHDILGGLRTYEQQIKRFKKPQPPLALIGA